MKLAEQARTLVQFGPHGAEIADTLGWVYHLKGQRDQALELLRLAARMKPSDPALRYRLGMAAFASDNKALAEEELEKAAAGRDADTAKKAKRMLEQLQSKGKAGKE